MKVTLTQILRAVSKSKGLKKPDKWVEKILKHAQIDSDYQSYVHLTSHKQMFFGVLDNLFPCQRFVLYRQYKNSDFEREIDEFEIYTFSDLDDKGFLEKVKEAYHSNFDSIVDIKLFLEAELVPFKVLTEDGKPAILGKYNELPETLTIVPELYQVKLKGDDKVRVYTTNKEKLRFEVLKLKDFNNGEDDDKSDFLRTVYKTDNFEVTYMGLPVVIELYTDTYENTVNPDNAEFRVDIIETYALGKETHTFLVGYIDKQNQTYLIPTAENLANFLMTYPAADEILITDELDTPFIRTMGSFVDYCRDKDFLIEELQPALIPLQQGNKKVGKIKLYHPSKVLYRTGDSTYEYHT